MDVRDQGLDILWLRIVSRSNARARARVTKYFNEWVQQVKMSELESDKIEVEDDRL
jgi:hypothetical protein